MGQQFGSVTAISCCRLVVCVCVCACGALCSLSPSKEDPAITTPSSAAGALAPHLLHYTHHNQPACCCPDPALLTLITMMEGYFVTPCLSASA